MYRLSLATESDVKDVFSFIENTRDYVSTTGRLLI